MTDALQVEYIEKGEGIARIKLRDSSWYSWIFTLWDRSSVCRFFIAIQPRSSQYSPILDTCSHVPGNVLLLFQR